MKDGQIFTTNTTIIEIENTGKNREKILFFTDP